MASLKKELISLLRISGLSLMADKARYWLMRLKNSKINHHFLASHPGVAFPPPYMMYESFQVNYQKYYDGGREDAEWIISLVKPYCRLQQIKILDWGCGPARIIRHLPLLSGDSNSYFGTDYNGSTISWCNTHIQGVTFSKNDLQPPLLYADATFNFIYGISILTHLSEENQLNWSKELYRIAASGCIVILTTHGDAFLEKLTLKETEKYHQQKPVLRDKTKEGHRTFGTFQPPEYMCGVFTAAGFFIESHMPGRRVHDTYISQDVWILKKYQD